MNRIGSLLPVLGFLVLGILGCGADKGQKAGIEVGNPSLTVSAEFELGEGDPVFTPLLRSSQVAMNTSEMTWTQLRFPLTQVRYFASYYYYMPMDPLEGQVIWPLSGLDTLAFMNVLSGDSLQVNFENMDIPNRSYLKDIAIDMNLSKWEVKSDWCPVGGVCTPVVITFPDSLQLRVRFLHTQLVREADSTRLHLLVRFYPKVMLDSMDFSQLSPNRDGIIHIALSDTSVLLNRFANAFNGWGYSYRSRGVELGLQIIDAATTLFDVQNVDRVKNGNMQERGKEWIFLTQLGGIADTSFADTAVCITIDRGGIRDYSIQWMQEDIEIVKGRHYRLSFTAWSDTTLTTFLARVGRYHAPYDNLDIENLDFVQELQTTPKLYEYEFTAKESTPFGRLEFNLGGWKRKVWLREVSLLRLDF